MKSVVWSAQGNSEKNEDACFARPDRGVFAVADGVGSGPAGELASRTTIELLSDALEQGELTENLVMGAIHSANAEIKGLSERAGYEGMACTLALAWVKADVLTCFHVGDSRIYKLRNQQLEQLTKDHAMLVLKSGARLKNVITRAIGIKVKVDVEITVAQWKHEDVLILMSDGVSDKLSNDDILKIMTDATLSMADKARRLTWESEARGGVDDKTVVLAF